MERGTLPQWPASIEAVIVPRAHDIGGFEVRRALPANERQVIGPSPAQSQLQRERHSRTMVWEQPLFANIKYQPSALQNRNSSQWN
jgi:hypothetical protein